MSNRIPPGHLAIKRAYEPAAADDGARVLIDRLWPRGVRKEVLALTEWAKPLSPSNELRHWFNHEPARWDEFRRRYAAELHAQPEALAAFAALQALARKGRVTLVYSSREPDINNAVALRALLLDPGSMEGLS